MGTIGDGSAEAAIWYCQDLEIEGISVGWGRVPGFKEKGYLRMQRRLPLHRERLAWRR